MLIELGCPELSVAWQCAALPALPPLFTVRAGQERAVDQSRQRLLARGLLDRQGVLSPDLRQAMATFAQAPMTMDLRSTASRGTGVTAAVAALDGVAFLAVVTGGHVRFSRIPAEAALPGLVHVLPAEAPARGTLVTLPTADVDAAVTGSMQRAMTRPVGILDSGDCLIAGLTRRGVARTDARLFVSLVGGKRLRTSEFGISFRDRSGALHRSSRTMRVLDVRRGRAVLHAKGDYLVAAPADSATVLRVLTELRDAEHDRLGGNRLG